MSIKEEEKILFDKLRDSNPIIVEDGIVDEAEYLASRYKILYVMKEVNGGEGWNLKEFLKDGARPQTWNNIARWTEGILNLEADYKWDYLDSNNEDRRKIMLKKIGSINLKKIPGKHTSNSNEITNEARLNKDLINKQVELYQPDIIICCGTFDTFVEIFSDAKNKKLKMTARGVRYIIYEDKIIISYAHPAARVRYAYIHYALMDALREILKIDVDKK